MKQPRKINPYWIREWFKDQGEYARFDSEEDNEVLLYGRFDLDDLADFLTEKFNG